jgi:hypothetical protein
MKVAMLLVSVLSLATGAEVSAGPLSPPIPPPVPPSPSPLPLTCPEKIDPTGVACEPALAGLVCEYGLLCACPPPHCQPCEEEEEICVYSTRATCGEHPVSGGNSGIYRWSIVISEPLAPPCPPPSKAKPPPPSPPPPPPPPSSPACVDTAKKCKNKQCENLAKQKKCKKFCGLCEPLPPSAPPSPSLPEVNCRGLSDDKACKIKIKKCEMKPPKSMKKCKKKCKNDAKKDPPLCQKTCCNLGFPI